MLCELGIPGRHCSPYSFLKLNLWALLMRQVILDKSNIMALYIMCWRLKTGMDDASNSPVIIVKNLICRKVSAVAARGKLGAFGKDL